MKPYRRREHETQHIVSSLVPEQQLKRKQQALVQHARKDRDAITAESPSDSKKTVWDT